jgi:hypothetical protein
MLAHHLQRYTHRILGLRIPILHYTENQFQKFNNIWQERQQDNEKNQLYYFQNNCPCGNVLHFVPVEAIEKTGIQVFSFIFFEIGRVM